MIILYDWGKIRTQSKGKLGDILVIFDMIVFKRKPRSHRDSRLRFYGKDFSGDSFMLDPESLLRYKNVYTLREIVQYILLCSYRSYSEYKLYGTIYLDSIKSPLQPQILQQNRLLQMDGNKIRFLFEELEKGEYTWR